MADGRVFIAGGTGFVGGNLLRALGERPVRLLVRNAAKSAALKKPNVELVEGDITKPDSLNGALNGCDVVVNLVAIIKESPGATFDGVIRQGERCRRSEARETRSLCPNERDGRSGQSRVSLSQCQMAR